MAEKDTVFSGKIKQKGIFDFKDFYSYSYDLLIEEGYSVSEKVYSEEITGDSKKIDISWEASKTISDYFKFSIKINWTIIGLKEVEVMKEGKKVKMNNASVEIKVKGVLVKDYENRWENHPFWKFLRGIYERYIIRSRIDDYESKLQGEAEEFIAQCKSYLALEGKK